jgi:hypothetical protein
VNEPENLHGRFNSSCEDRFAGELVEEEAD